MVRQMSGEGRRPRRPWTRRATRLAALGAIACAGLSSCAWLPSELNLSPLYRHRLAEDGRMLELDLLWPVFHYEETAEGGDDFRVRPLWRRVTEPESLVTGGPAVEHQFLWPLGRARTDGDESSVRVFPLLWHRSRPDDLGLRENDWFFLFPLFWGGTRSDGGENYFGMFPLAGDFPDFLTYSRFTFVLWPLYLRLEKEGRHGTTLLWPFINWGSDSDGTTWHRFWPLWSFLDGPARWYRSIFWPIFSWGVENLDSDDPLARYLIWPFFGRQWNRTISAWTVLFPFFQSSRVGDRRQKVDVLWPIFRFEEWKDPDSPLWQWWIFPLISHTVTNDQWAWNMLWPLIWLREYHDPEDVETQEFVIPIYYHTHRAKLDGREESKRQVWPFAKGWYRGDAEGPLRGGWSTLAPWPYSGANAAGLDELWGWSWTLAQAQRRGRDDTAFNLIAHLYTTRTRGSRSQTSVPFLFNYQSDSGGGTLRLFQFIPIPFGGGAPRQEQP